MKLFNQVFPYILVLTTFLGFFGKSENKDQSHEIVKVELSQAGEASLPGTIMFIVRGNTKLSDAEIKSRMKERAPEFEALSGLIQKYYIKTKNPGEFGGVYIWDSMNSFNAYRESDLIKTIAAAYELTGTPSTELIDIMFELRE